MSTVSGGWDGPAIVKNGLVLYLDAGSPNSFYPLTAGTTWKDISGLANNETLTNGPIYSTVGSGSISFDGVDDFVLGPSSTSLNFGTGNFTINAWFRTNTTSRRTILSRFDYDNTGGIERGYYMDVLANGKVRTGFETNGSNYRITDSNTLVNTNSYFYATLTRTNETTANVYINGIFETSNLLPAGTPSNVDAVTAPFSVARVGTYQTPIGLGYFIGNISLVQIYNRALSASEINQNFQATRARFGI